MERSQDNMEVRLDAKVTNEAETRALGIEVGTLYPLIHVLSSHQQGFIKSRFLDDKVSAAILLTLLKKYKSEGITLPVTTHFMFSCIEETGTGSQQ